jgi:hypothetical protein
VSEHERVPLDDGYEDSLIRRELCPCGDVLITPRFASSERVQEAVERHNKRQRHRTWAQHQPDWPR